MRLNELQKAKEKGMLANLIIEKRKRRKGEDGLGKFYKKQRVDPTDVTRKTK